MSGEISAEDTTAKSSMSASPTRRASRYLTWQTVSCFIFYNGLKWLDRNEGFSDRLVGWERVERANKGFRAQVVHTNQASFKPPVAELKMVTQWTSVERNQSTTDSSNRGQRQWRDRRPSWPSSGKSNLLNLISPNSFYFRQISLQRSTDAPVKLNF